MPVDPWGHRLELTLTSQRQAAVRLLCSVDRLLGRTINIISSFNLSRIVHVSDLALLSTFSYGYAYIQERAGQSLGTGLGTFCHPDVDVMTSA